MTRFKFLKSMLAGGVSALALSSAALAEDFNIPAGDLKNALNAYASQTGVAVLVSDEAIKGARTRGVKGDLSADDALSHILADTGFVTYRHSRGVVGIARDDSGRTDDVQPIRMTQGAPMRVAAASAVESVVVTSSKIKGDIQTVPIAITALSQEQLTSRQIAGGPDLVKEVPNLTFTKTNFTGYSIQIRGIGTQAISVSTDPAVAVAFNDIPFIRNHFFEQEFYDVGQVEVLRGPQGTLYGRNATAGVVNMVSAKPTDQYEAMASVDVGNYNNRRLEAMLNVPVVGDKLDLRVAGEWTKRDGYTFDTTTDKSTDGRDLWSGRVSVLVHPIENLTATVVWEHFQENDDRLRSAKTLCTTDPGPSSVDGPDGLVTNIDVSGDAFLSQGCKQGSLYSPSAFGVPNPGSLPIVAGNEYAFSLVQAGFNPYGTLSQSPDLRVIGSALQPHYRAHNDTLEFNADYQIAPSLTLTSQTGYNKDSLYSTEDFNRFNTVSGGLIPFAGVTGNDGIYCDPQLGCSDRFLAQDVSDESSEQFYQEVRVASNFSGPLNFSAGASYLHYTTIDNYYVFSNYLSMFQQDLNLASLPPQPQPDHIPFDPVINNSCGPVPSTLPFEATGLFGLGCGYIDPNPLSSIDGQGHNYFRSENPYRLHSWAGFGEVNYQIAPDVKLTGGLRWTDDQKSFTEIPSWADLQGKGYPSAGIIDQQWKELTGRFNATWTPKLDFTDQSMFYGSYSRGYKGGGANPPGVVPVIEGGILFSSPSSVTHPLTFAPEFINAYELGTKNSLLDGAMTLDGDIFYYDYTNYQISEIVDRTAVNLNFNATVKGAELEATWEPTPGLRFNFAGGYEETRVANGQKAVDLMDRTAGNPAWMVVKPFPTETSNCILPTYVINELISGYRAQSGGNNSTPASAVPANIADGTNGLYFYGDGSQALSNACIQAYTFGVDPVAAVTGQNSGFDPATAPNNGEGFNKDLGGNELPNSPHVTISFGAQYSMPVRADWVGTLRGDFYAQTGSWARIFNDNPYDRIRGYTNLNLALIFSNQDGWQTMAYAKNVFDTTAITGAFLNSDDTGLSTNIFTTDPRLFGIRITKNW